MRSLVALALALCLPLLLLAEDKKEPRQGPGALTPEEIRDGWLLLFDGETTFGWQIDGEAKVEKGVLILGGKKKTVARFTALFDGGKVELQGRSKGKGMVGIELGGAVTTVRGNVNLTSCGAGPTSSPRSPCQIDVPADTTLEVSKARLRPFVLGRLFDGKDLKGWKQFEGKGKKSKFTVTREGWLNVKDGPGDLQTVKVFDDFVLQLECISNGKHLNSGLFFRCIPGEYQNGYEAQIHNHFDMKPPRKYTVEEYDPKTHKLVGKRTVESTAKDWGTGAIYRRMPARKGVAKDKEWFAMTVMARGRHLATWVNGIQQVDWTDNRPADRNPRKGYRDEAGAISIQGHDPTTDLSFRNIRIAVLPRPKP